MTNAQGNIPPGTSNLSSWEWYQALAQRLPGMSAQHSAKPKTAIYDDIRMLGAMLGLRVAAGSVNKAEEGQKQFALIEDLRRQAKKSRLLDQTPGLEEIEAIIQRISTDNRNFRFLEQLLKAIDAFRIFLELASLAESYHHNKAAQDHDSITAWIQHAKANGIALEQLNESLQKVSLRLVSTAHPTQIFRTTYLTHHKSILDALNAFHQADNRHQQQAAIEDLEAVIYRLWLTTFVRWDQPTVLDEAKAINNFLDILYEALPDLQMSFAQHLQETYGTAAPEQAQPFFQVGSWVGGDMDGNPNANAETLSNIFTLRSHIIMNKYLQELETLAPLYSFSITSGVLPTRKLVDSIESDVKEFQIVKSKPFKRSGGIQKYHLREPFRQKLVLMATRISHTLFCSPTLALGTQQPFVYQTAEALLEDVNLLLDEGRKNQFPSHIIAPLQKFAWAVKTFGFHFTGLDLREDTRFINQAVKAVLKSQPVYSGFPDATHADYYNRLCQELLSTERNAINNDKLQHHMALYSEFYSDQGQFELRVLAMMGVMKQAQTALSQKASPHFLLSMTHGSLDILHTLFLLKLHELVSVTDGQLNGTVDIVPLFETIADLKAAPEIMETLFKTPVYRDYLRSRGNRQVVLIAYSDSNKDGGYMTSQWYLYRTQQVLMDLAKQYDLSIQFYHGRGGSIGRGGGPTRQNILSLPKQATENGIQITEQGEVLARHYLTRESTETHLNNMLLASLDALLANKQPESITAEWQALMTQLSDQAFVNYQSLIGMPSFVEYFNYATPKEIEEIHIGSRPAKRRQSVRIEDLRAIPWVFRWSQSRTMIPGWFGVGAALAEIIKQSPNNLPVIQQMYQQWPFFKSLMDNCALALLQSDMHIANHYKTLLRHSPVPEEHATEIYQAIRYEFDQTHEMLKQVCGQTELLSHADTIQRRQSIEMKRAYLDPLNYLQVYLLEKYRQNTNNTQDIHEFYQRAFISSTGGIVAGLGTSG